MESRIKIFGHPAHPKLVVFPLGLLATAVMFDGAYVATGNEDLATFSYWALLAGIVGGALASVFGFIDWMGIPRATRARRIGAIHGVGNVIVLLIFLLSFATRDGSYAYLPDLLPFLLGLAGAAVTVVTAWLGGELVYRLRVGVDDDAGLDASSSLSREGPLKVTR